MSGHGLSVTAQDGRESGRCELGGWGQGLGLHRAEVPADEVDESGSAVMEERLLSVLLSDLTRA
ncbi:hypothetical protein [Streptomyces sp. WM6386]|uniref:hypothetical protein n=1 Tax=Streptomyces sp. WM6386 TaxID=1415558 RepID=UPI0006192095|nr:hypothetical protein [Streptomyces sp. WM6386]KKD05790.1 hypothetical protein TN53_22185 [Streptomyces sp. WM6386]